MNNQRLDFGHSFSSGFINYAVLLDGGKSLLAPDAVNSTNYREQFANMLGLISQINAQYNYDVQGNVLPQGRASHASSCSTTTSSMGRTVGRCFAT